MKTQMDDVGGIYIGDSIYVSVEVGTDGLVMMIVDAPSRMPITPASVFQDTRSTSDSYHRVNYAPMISELVN